MEIDKTTYYDLSIFNHEEEYSLLHKLNFCKTAGGSVRLEHLLLHPLNKEDKIRETQDTIRIIIEKESAWPLNITNGTIMVMEKFFEYPFDRIPSSYSPLSGALYKIFSGPDYSLARYSFSHFVDFFKGFNELLALFSRNDYPQMLQHQMDKARDCFDHPEIKSFLQVKSVKAVSRAKMLRLMNYLRYEYRFFAEELIDVFHQLDAWCSMAIAVKKFNLHFPDLYTSDAPDIHARGLYHILLKDAIAYDVAMDENTNFLFLTGANMAGKSTFIKAIGIAVYLAHLGMGVPAKEMRMTLFEGILSNINVFDNVIKGESFFFNEVQRVKNTVLKINDGKKWLVLIDELFKGTNIQDAMNCSTTVIKGLLKINHSLFILSTHLYEIGENLKSYPNITFKYFETSIENEELKFTYQLRDGISNDRLGYLILKKEKVVELLEKL